MNSRNIPLNDLSVLIPNRFKERITRWYEDRSPAVIRTYDIMNNELIKELRYFNNGTLMVTNMYGILFISRRRNSVIPETASPGNSVPKLVRV